MQKIFFQQLLAILILTSCSVPRNFITTTARENRTKDGSGNEILLGNNPRSALYQKPFAEWYEKNYKEYKVDSAQLPALRALLAKKKVNLTVFLGTWCGDSKREVPRILKILDAAGMKEDRVQLVMVSAANGSYKQSPDHEEAGLRIFRVPSFILSKNGTETGRIIEFPKESLEKDLVAILHGNKYEPNYLAGHRFFQYVDQQSIIQLRTDFESKEAELQGKLRNRAELSSIGYVLKDAGNLEKAIFVFEMNARLYPAEISVHNALAEAYMESKETEKAKRSLEKAKAIDANNSETIRISKLLN